jgi:hypothetical protein
MTLDERQRNIRKAARTGTCCAKCARQLEPSEPVWRVRVSFGPGFFGRWSCGVAPFCEACSKPEHKHSLARPCEGCGRPVHHLPSWLRPYAPPPRHALCSHACKGRQQSATARSHCFAMELKAEGGRATDKQLACIAALREAGAFTCIAEGLGRALACLEAWGILRGKAQ